MKPSCSKVFLGRKVSKESFVTIHSNYLIDIELFWVFYFLVSELWYLCLSRNWFIEAITLIGIWMLIYALLFLISVESVQLPLFLLLILLIYSLLSWLVWLEGSLQRAHGLNLLMISSEFLWILDLLSLHKLIRQFLRINLFPTFRDSNYKYIMLLEVCLSSLILCSYFQSFLLCCVFKFTNLFFSISNLPSIPCSVCVSSQIL